MKKLSILICCVFLLQMICGCSGKKEEFRNPVNFYYCNKEVTYNSPAGVISSEIREGAGFYGNLTAFLHTYLIGPESDDLITLIPSDVYLVSCEQQGDEVTLVFSKSFEKLSGIDLSAACCALLWTVHDYTGANLIKISVKDGQLDDKDQISFHISDVILSDNTGLKE